MNSYVDANIQDGTQMMARPAASSQIMEVSSPQTQNSVTVAIQKSEVESQLDVAKKYPRKISAFIDEAKAMIQRSTDVAEMCFFSLPRKDRNKNPIQIMGPSVRLAEIAASAYENLHVGARPLDVGINDTDCVSQGVVWDLQKNVRYTIECRRRITYKNGGQYNADMITMTQNAASSIALRNAIFRVIPRAYIDELYNHARSVAVGDSRAIGEKRQKVVAKLIKMGTTEERILAKIGREDVEQITAEDLETLIGIGTAIKEKMATVDEQFPKTASEEPARGGAEKYLENKKASGSAKGKKADKHDPWAEIKAMQQELKMSDDDLAEMCKTNGMNVENLSDSDVSTLTDILTERLGMQA